MAGVDFNQLLGLITGSNEIVQNAGKTANAYKTILTNLMTKDLEKQFNEFGLTMREQNGQMKSGYDILIELGNKYNQLGTTWSEDDEAMISLNDSMNKLMKDIAGAFNINVLSAGFQNVATTVQATESAMNSANSATDEYAVAMDSIAKKSEGLSGAFQELMWGKGGLNELLKGFLDISTLLVKFASSDVGSVIIQVGLLTTSFIALKAILDSTIVNNVAMWFSNLAVAISMAKVEATGFISVLNVMNINPVILAITALTAVGYGAVKAFDYFNESLEETQEKIDGLNTESEATTSKIESINKQLSDYYNNIKAINSDSGLVKDGELETLILQTQELEKQLEIEQEKQRLTNIKLEESATKTVNTKQVISREYDPTTGFEKSTEGTRVDALKLYADEMQKASDNIDRLSKAKSDLIKQGEQESFMYGMISKSLSDYQADYDYASEAGLKYYQELEAETRGLSENSEIRKYVQAGLDYYTDSLVKSTDATVEASATTEDVSKTYEDLATAYDDASSNTSDLISNIDGLSSALKEQDESGSLSLATQLSLIDSGYALALSFDEQTGACTLNVEAMKSLTEAKIQDQIADLQILQNDIATKLKSDGIIAMESAKGFLFLASAKSANGDSAEAVKSYNEAESKINALSSALENMKSSSAGAWASSIKGADKSSSATKDAEDAIKDLKDEYDTAIDVINNQLDKYIDKLEDAKDNALDAIDDQIDALEEAKDVELESIDERIDKLEKLKDVRLKAIQDEVDAYKKLSDETKSYYDKLLSDIDEQNKATEESIKLQQLQDALASAKQQKVMVFEGGEFVYKTNLDAVAKAQQELDAYQLQLKAEAEVKAIEDSRDAELSIYEQKIADLQMEYDSMEILYDKKIEKLESHRKEVEAEYDQQLEDLKEHREQVEEQYDAQIEYYENFKEQFKLMTEEYTNQQDMLLAEQLTGISLENANWMDRLANLSSFVDKYNAILAKMRTAPSSSGGSSTGGSSTSSGGTSGNSSSSASGLSIGAPLSGSANSLSQSGSSFNMSPNSVLGLSSSLSPLSMSAMSGSNYSTNSSANNNVTNIHVASINLPSVTDSNSFVAELSNFKSMMIQESHVR